ncbi:GAF and ANTAR domain-containing protein [Streptomyces sp. NPDC053367]|uniref:GAF and ANTAR domain-containing protein n=1 Tax=Streptomyces sp. NPDC053367 TaxID=3365700 RepID=UPI0037D65D28
MGQSDERDRALDALADEVRGAEPGELLGRLCGMAGGLLRMSGAGVLLCSDGMPVPLTATSERAAQVMELQTDLGEGPSLDASRTGTPVLAPDLSAGPDADRWPVFAPLATSVGVRALYALPLGCDPCCVGTLDLCRDAPGELSAPDLRTAQLVAGVVTVALTTLQRGEEGESEDGDADGRRAPWLGELAAAHDTVHQAVGMIMARLRIAADEALARLRAHAFARGRTLPEAARDIVTHRVRLEPDLTP